MNHRMSWARWAALACYLVLAGCSSGGGGGGGGDDNGGGDSESITVTPNQVSVEPEQEVELTVLATGIEAPVYTFAVVPPASLTSRQATDEEIARRFGSVDAEGVFVAGAEADEGARGGVRVTETTSGERATVDILIVPAIREVLITPDSASLLAGASTTFRAEAIDFNDDEVPGVLVDWRVTGGVGTIDQSGVFRAVTAGEGTIEARVGLAPAAVAEVTVVGTVTGLQITPRGDPVDVETGTTRQFRAIVRDGEGNETEVTATWTVTPASLGTITAAGLFTAGASGGEGEIRATAQGQTVDLPVRVIDLITPPSDAPGNVGGRVTNQAGDPVAGATVTALRGAIEVDETTTNADGRYGLFLPAGTYRLEASGAGGAAARDGVSLPAQDVRVRVNLQLQP